MFFTLVQTFFVGLTNDTNMLAHTTGHLLFDGGLYRSYLTVNLPFIYYLDALPVLASAALHLSPALALHGFTALCTLSSLAYSSHILARGGMSEERRHLWIFAAAVALIPAPCIFHTYGDREHYLFILAMPWLLQLLLNLTPPPLSIVLAVCGCFIKPYNIVLVFILSLQRRLLHTATFPIASVMLIFYAAFILNVYPEYMTVILPAAFRSYSTLTYPIALRLRETFEYLLAILPLTLLIRPADRLAYIKLITAVAAIYCLNAGWLYTVYLLSVPPILMLPALITRGKPVHSLCAAAILVLVISLSSFNLGRDVYYAHRYGSTYAYNNLPEEVKADLVKAAGENFVLLSPHLWSSAISAIHGAPHSVYAYDDSPWPMPWIAKHSNRPEAKEMWHQLMAMPLLTAMQKSPSPALLVDESPKPYPDFFRFFLNDPYLSAALHHYSRVGLIDHCRTDEDYDCRFTVWRKDLSQQIIPH